MHVGLVVVTGFAHKMNHITVGRDDAHPVGMIIGLAGIAAVVGSWVFTHYVAWNRPRMVQHLHKTAGTPFLKMLSKLAVRGKYTDADISPYLWVNGKAPVSDDWKRLAKADFRDFKLKVGGLVESPKEFSLDDLKALGKSDHISMQHCIQGWSGVAHWGGVSLERIIEIVKPKPGAKVIVFYSFGEGLFGGNYYDTQIIEVALRGRGLLAYEMNHAPLPETYGAPLRLRVENQLGYKMVKWVNRIEFVESEKNIGKGEGGKNEDDEYFDLLPMI